MSFFDWVYRGLTKDESVDKADDSVVAAPKNFVLNLLNGSATKLAEQLASPDLVLVWLLGAIGAPVAFAGMLEPIRRGAATVPQLVVSGRMRGYRVRKWFWVGAGLFQAGMLLVMIVAAVWLPGVWAGVAILTALFAFSLASGVGSVAFKAVLPKTIPEDKRGQLLGWRSSIGGGLTIVAGIVLYRAIAGSTQITPYLVLIGIAAGLWVLGAVFFSLIEEPAETIQNQRKTLEEAITGINLVKDVHGFRLFISARALLLGAELAIPFYAILAHQLTNITGIALFVATLGLAALIGSPVWGRISDLVSNRITMVLGGLVGAVATVTALSVSTLSAGHAVNPYLLAAIFLVAGLARDGVRVGRKSYIVNAAPEDERPLYVAAASTIAGVLMFAFLGVSLIPQYIGITATLGTLLILQLAGAAVAWYMPEAHDMV